MASKLFVKGKQLSGAVANALKINCKDKDGNKSTVQAELNKTNSSLTNENNETFNFGVKDGVRGYFTDPSRADDSFIPFKLGVFELLKLFSNQSSSSTNASYNTYTFEKDYSTVLIIIQMHDTDNNNDNYCKVFDSQQSGTAWANFKDSETSWESINLTSFLPGGTSLSGVDANYSLSTDKGKTLYYTTGTTSSTAFNVLTYKQNVKAGDVAHIYYNSYRRGLVTILGIM